MRITMVKKQLANGEPCEKCAQTEEMLRRRGLWDEIAEVVWAIEGDPESAGNRIGARHGVRVAPFFVVETDDGAEEVVTSPLKLIRQYFPDAPRTPAAHTTGGRDVSALARRLEGAEPERILAFALERFGERCPIAFSGAEEVVLIDMATRLRLPFRVFTLDTGRLHAETYAFLDEVRRRYGVVVEAYLPDAAMLGEFVRRKGANSFYRDGHRECCAIRKVAPLSRALRGCDAWVTGRRRDQSPATRSELSVIGVGPRPGGGAGELVTVNPLAGWSHEQVWDYIRRHDVPCNPLHEQGYASIGCEPCTRAVGPDQPVRSGRWWWESDGARESGLHAGGDGI
jgi:phosphoadenosine phosphosulfate reductase